MSLEDTLGLDKKLVMKYKQVFISLKTSFKIPLKIIYLVKKGRKPILVEWEWTKKFLTMNRMEKHITKKHSIREY